jgi:hypothetical protein
LQTRFTSQPFFLKRLGMNLTLGSMEPFERIAVVHPGTPPVVLDP